MCDAAAPHRVEHGEDITQLIKNWQHGDQEALVTLMKPMMQELRFMARRFFQNEAKDHTLQPTALVNELYIRLFKGEALEAKNRVHFLALSARRMRQILVDHARKANSRSPQGKRGWKVDITSLEDRLGRPQPELDLLELNEALEKLKHKDARKCAVVEMRYFAGLTYEEIGCALGVSTRTINREWVVARARLFAFLTEGKSGQ